MDIISKRVLYCYIVIWAVSLVISIWNPIDLYPVSFHTYLLLMINVLSCVLGFSYLKISPRTQSNLDYKKLDASIEAISSSGLFYFIVIAAIVYSSWIMIQNFQMIIFTQSLADVRGLYFEDVEKLYGYGFVTARDFILNPLSVIASPLFAYLFYKKKNLISILLGIFLIEHASIGGGRIGYARIFIVFIFVLYCLLTHEPRKKKIRLVGIVAAVFVFLIMAATMMRSGNTNMSASSVNNSREETFEQITMYVAGPIVAFDYALKDDYVNKMSGYSYGVCTFCSVDRLLQPLLKVINPQRLPASNKFIGFKQKNMISISSDRNSYNALYTAVLFFYLDFGILGVIFLPFFFGMVFRYLIKLVYLKNNVAILSLASWIYVKFMTSNLDLYFISHLDILTVIALLIWINMASYSPKDNKVIVRE